MKTINNNNNNFTPVAIYRLRLKNSNKKMLKVLGAVSVMFFLPFVFDLSFLLDNDAWLIIFLHPDYVFFLLNIKRNYVEGSLTENSGLTPDYVTGFSDAEGCFSITIVEGKYSKAQVTLSFRVSQKSHSAGVLRDLIKFFGAGVVSKPSKRNQVVEMEIVDETPLRSATIIGFRFLLGVVKVHQAYLMAS
jgi:hypothetical protein